ncbi:actin-like protein ARP6 [Wolfiporia cocos MD-104 SS10]|uniref:Actin-like protein ARP6 n=1 Tax=Wolfiporia cocos (strain MD-104) TaxID=742152 RepID=A0A2H3JC94_WOLCO|nr:actin-like protein ARP6 [Wolfiporia cocos MD-104 SS10]
MTLRKSATVVADNGASTIKAGVMGVHDANSRVITNAIVRSKGDKTTYIGHELGNCRDYSSLHYRRPFEKGYIVDWDAEKAIWDGMFSNDCLEVDTSESNLLITEPYFNLPNIQEVYDQFVFEEYEFQSYYRCTPASLLPYSEIFNSVNSTSPECLLVIDSGFSFTHIVPILNGAVVWKAVKRLDVGGKLLTNQLKELASFRQWNMMDETHIINDIKESCCYVATDLKKDMETTRTDPKRNPIVQEYILPDFSINRSGRIRQAGEALPEAAQVMYMNNERFTVPEIIFRPDDIGLEQLGVASAVASSVALLPEDLQGMFWAHIGLIGGNAKFPGFCERLHNELRSLAPNDCEVSIYLSNEPLIISSPILEAYRSAVAFARTPEFAQRVVTREEYLEMGSNACRRKFADWKPIDKDATKGRDQTRARGTTRTREGTTRTREELDETDSPPPPKKGAGGKTRTRTSISRRQA